LHSYTIYGGQVICYVYFIVLKVYQNAMIYQILYKVRTPLWTT